MNSKYLREDIIRMSGVNPKKCMRCGKCVATCPAYDELDYKPYELINMVQLINMVENGEIEPLLNSKSIYRCMSCFACVERCPRGVEPAKLAEAVRLVAERRQGGSRITANDASKLIDDDVPQQLLVSVFRKYTK